jgi:hypothetical protein
MTIRYTVTGLDEMIDAMDALTKPPTPLTIAKLDAVLEEGYAMTQDQVHVISEELKLSGDTDSKFTGYSWQGAINYGGISDTPAYYAIYELNRGGARPDGTPHDFFTGLEVLDEKFEDAIDSYFEPLKG